MSCELWPYYLKFQLIHFYNRSNFCSDCISRRKAPLHLPLSEFNTVWPGGGFNVYYQIYFFSILGILIYQSDAVEYWNHNRKKTYHLHYTNWITVQICFSVCSLSWCWTFPVPRKACMGWSQIKLYFKFILLVEQILYFMLGWAMHMPSQPWHAGLGSSGRLYSVLIITGNLMIQWCGCLI